MGNVKNKDAMWRVKQGFNVIRGDLRDFKSWRGGWRRVFICAPYDGPLTRSREKIWNYCMFAKEHQYLPVAPDYYYSEFLNFYDKKEKELAARFALEDLRQCREIWVFGDELTPEMERMICSREGKDLNVIQFPDWDELLEFEREEETDE